MASLLSLGAIVLGAVLRGADWLSRVRRPDLLVSVAWTVSLSSVIAWICIFAIAAFTAGYGLTDEMIVSVLALGGFAGIAYGLASFWYQHSSGTVTPRSIKPTVQDSTEVGIPTAQTPIRSRAASTGAGLFWFTIGVLSAGCLTLAGGWLASFFRGPVAGTTVLGTTRYALDQTPVNAITGLSISVMGWILGVVVFRFRARRALAVGLILGTTLLGVTFALWK
jgi:hypothetical protein